MEWKEARSLLYFFWIYAHAPEYSQKIRMLYLLATV